MGKVNLTELQKLVFDKIAQDNTLKNIFYFSGGTALSVFYLYHRYSEDLDFFSEKEFDKQLVIRFISLLARSLNLKVRMTKKQMVLLFELQKEDRETLKIDFLHFPYPRLDKGLTYKQIKIDSVKDIGVNKLILLNLTEEAKDYVDLYFILKEKYSILDLIKGVKTKFNIDLDLISLGEDFLNAERLKFLPKMVKPLTLDQLKTFFKQEAKKLGKIIIK